MTFRTISRFLPLQLALIFALATPLRAQPMTFATGSLIIPMDKDFQDSGMLAAFGLVDKLLHAGVRVNWCIQPGKAVGGTDFTASAKDSRTGAVITNHGYRGGPFVIDAADAAAAMPVVTAWQAARPTVAVHVATTQLAATRRLLLTASPRVAVLADGAQNIVFGYLNAAGIPDENALPWSSSSVDLLTPTQVAGPTLAGIDGALFDAEGVPVFSALLSGNYSVASADIPNVMQELNAFLQYPVLVFAEGQSAIAFESGANGHWLTSAGYSTIGQPTAVQLSSADLPFAQMDGAFKTVGGSSPAYTLSPGSGYRDGGSVLLRGSGQDVFVFGFVNGTCPISSFGACTSTGPKGRVAYLGGYQYTTNVPISTNPTTQGVRLFLNSLFAGSGTIAEAQPDMSFVMTAPDTVTTPALTVTLTLANGGAGVALGAKASYTLPTGAQFLSASNGGVVNAGVVSWNLGNAAPGSSLNLSVAMNLPAYGTYTSQGGSVTYRSGLTPRQVSSNQRSTVYAQP